MKKDLSLLVIILIVGFIIAFIESRIILEIGEMHKLTFITQFSWKQIFVIIMLMSLFLSPVHKAEKYNVESVIAKSLSEVIGFIIVYGMCYLVYIIK